MKTLKLMMASAILITMFATTACSSYNYVPAQQQTIYENPEWAPEYYSNVRYYYLPDIEVYYDLTMREFIYLNNGRWLYSRMLPPMYSYYDIYSGYVIILDVNIYRPWMHHQYYVSHYPRYYYRDYYDRSNFAYVRGFNENMRSAIYWKENERNRAREWNDENLRNNRRFKYSAEDRRQQNPYNETSRRTSDNNQNTTGNAYDRNTTNPNDNANRRQQDNNTTSTRKNNGNPTRTETETKDTNRNTETNRNGSTRTENTGTTQTNRSDNTTRQQPNAPVTGSERQTQKTNYYGRTIGTSVKVERQMRNPTPETTQGTSRSGSSTEGTPRTNGTNRTNSTNSTDQNNQRR